MQARTSKKVSATFCEFKAVGYLPEILPEKLYIQRLHYCLMRIGIIDLGTNTFNLLIAEVDDRGSYSRLYNSKIPVKLGEGGINQNEITDEAMQRAFHALEAQVTAIQNFYCDRILAFATSAVRGAHNGGEFVREVKQRFGFQIRVIDGNQEAEHIYHGVQFAGAIQGKETALIMDIGGGSTEFILCDTEEILWKESYDLGVSRLLQKFNLSDPIKPEEIATVERYILSEIGPMLDVLADQKPDILIGSSGSFDTLCEMILARFYATTKADDLVLYDFKLEDFRKIHDIIIHSTQEQRLSLPGLVKMRVDMIVLASLFINLILQKTGLRKMRLSAYALKEGVLFHVLKGNL